MRCSDEHLDSLTPTPSKGLLESVDKLLLRVDNRRGGSDAAVYIYITGKAHRGALAGSCLRVSRVLTESNPALALLTFR